MNREQQEVLKLLKEIDTICRKHQISYYLSPRLTLRAVTGNPLPASTLAGAVIMKLPDMERFRKVMETELYENRALESMKNNKYFPGLYLRYENTDTLCFRLSEGRNFQHPGIGVDIIPLRSLAADKKTRSWDRRLEVGWIQTCDCGYAQTDFYKVVCGGFVRLLGAAGRERLGSWIYDRLCRNQNTDEAKRYTLQWNRVTDYVYPASVFEQSKEIVLEGEKFLIPGDEETYLRKVFGTNYEKRVSNAVRNDFSIMVSAQVGCDEFLKNTEMLEKLIKARKKQLRADRYVKRYKEYFEQCWEYAKHCGSKRKLGAFYLKKKDYIKNLWEDRDYVRLESVFASYGRMMRRCLNREEIFDIDEEILEIFLGYLGAIGRVEFLKEIEKYRN